MIYGIASLLSFVAFFMLDLASKLETRVSNDSGACVELVEIVVLGRHKGGATRAATNERSIQLS